ARRQRSIGDRELALPAAPRSDPGFHRLEERTRDPAAAGLPGHPHRVDEKNVGPARVASAAHQAYRILVVEGQENGAVAALRVVLCAVRPEAVLTHDLGFVGRAERGWIGRERTQSKRACKRNVVGADATDERDHARKCTPIRSGHTSQRCRWFATLCWRGTQSPC